MHGQILNTGGKRPNELSVLTENDLKKITVRRQSNKIQAKQILCKCIEDSKKEVLFFWIFALFVLLSVLLKKYLLWFLFSS